MTRGLFALRTLVLAALLGCYVWAETSTTLTVNVQNTGHTISPLLFGDANEWDQAQDLIQTDTNTATVATLRTDQVNRLAALGVTIMRYPGGGVSQFFAWNQSTGPWQNRIPQVTNDSLVAGNTSQHLLAPIFGPDEFTQLAQALGTDMIMVVDIVNQTPSQAAAWLTDLKSKGKTVRYWEIGNEPYLSGNDASTLLARLSASQYATAYDSFATALRAVDPSIQVGMVGCHDAPGTITLCNEANWNQTVLTNVHQKIDFMAIHDSYAPLQQALIDDNLGYAALLAAPQRIRTSIALSKADIESYADATSKNMTLAITEHSALWLPTAESSTLVASILRNSSWGSALFTALSYNVFLADPKIRIAVHHNMTSPYWQAALTTAQKNVGFPAGYDPRSIESAYGYVFQLYKAAANGTYLPVTVANSPTFTSSALGNVPVETDVPILDAMAVVAASPAGRTYLYVVNRSLTQDQAATIRIEGLNATLSGAAGQQIAAPLATYNLSSIDATSLNVAASATAVQPSAIAVSPVSHFEMTFPAHSLTRLTLDAAGSTTTSLDDIHIFPNPLRPALGHTQMNFTHLPPDARVRVYTLTGEKVRDLHADALGQGVWDGLNGAGQKAASGVYVVFIEGSGTSKTMKVAIQR